MSGGLFAIRGFDFQATVILDLLIRHFDAFGPAAWARPEGTDDLDLDDGLGNQTFFQIKKRHEDLAGKAMGSVWSLNDAYELLTKSLERLRGNAHRQVWLLGDDASDELRALVDAAAPEASRRAALLNATHLLARKSSLNLTRIEAAAKRRLENWSWDVQLPRPLELGTAVAEMASAYRGEAERLGVAAADAARYVTATASVARELESTLPRISLLASYGRENEVANRVTEALRHKLGTSRNIAEDTLFRNLRGFISDVSKVHERRIDKAMFEDELVSVWPHMIAVKTPPMPEADFISRAALASQLAESGGGILEVLGTSGSGKTSLAGDAVRAFEAANVSGLAYYVEAAADVSVRNIVVGLAYRLRRFGGLSSLDVILDGRASSEQVIEAFGRAIATLSRPVCAFVDFTAGGAEDPTGVDLAKLALQIAGVTPNFRLVLLSQETPFRNLSEFDRQAKQIQTLSLPGFTRPEFESLAELNGMVAERQQLYDVYMRVTAGRTTGMLPKLATALAKSETVVAMEALATLPAESMLESADRGRFLRVPEHVRPAAAMLSCFALPFSRIEAEEAFRNEPIGAAIIVLRDLGLLRRRDEFTFEMHETVRRGLEGTLAVAVREQAHADLAAWYSANGNIPAEVLHLSRARHADEANARARASFMAGDNWPSLVDFVKERRLLSGSEAAQLLAECNHPGSANLLLALFDGLTDGEEAARILLTRLDTPSTAASTDEYFLRTSLASAVLRAHPQSFPELIELALSRAVDSHGHDSWMWPVTNAARQVRCALGPASLALFANGDDSRKRRLLSLLLEDGGQHALSLALAFISQQPTSIEPRTQANWSAAGTLRLDTLAGVQSFLAAVPSRPAHEFMVHKCPLLHGLAPLIWSNRNALKLFVPDALRDAGSSQVVRLNGLRVLAALGDERTVSIADELPREPHAPHILARILMPWLTDPVAAERNLLDVEADLNERIGSLSVLMGIGADFGRLLARLESTDSTYSGLWRTIILPMCGQYPFVEAIPIVKAHLEADPDYTAGSSVTHGLGKLRTPEVTEFLVWALQHAGGYTRMSALLALSSQRTSLALPGLEQAARMEADQPIGANIVYAMAASHPTTSAPIGEACERFPVAAHWRFIVAGRLAEESMAEAIVSASTSPTLGWRVRRAAILAAGRLPFASALAHIVVPLLAERSTYPDDLSGDLRAHHAMTVLLSKGVTAVFSSFVTQRDEFISFLAPLVEQLGRQGVFPAGTPNGSHTATWLYDRLLAAGHPGNSGALGQVVSELQVPILQAALLRSLRLSGRMDLVISTIATASTLWLAIRCVIEAFRVRQADLALCDAIEEAANRSSFRGNSQFDGVLRECLEARRRGIAAMQSPPAENIATPPAGQPTPRPLNPEVRSEHALAALSDTSISIEINAPLVVVTDSVDSLQRLALALNPARDYTAHAIEAPASLRLSSATFSVGEARTGHTDNRAALRGALRPAVAAASGSPDSIVWHEPLLRGAIVGRSYPQLYLEALIGQSNQNRFFDALAEAEDVLAPLMFQSDTMAAKAARYADPRLLGLVLKYQAAGDDAFFGGMCRFLLAFSGNEADLALAAMLKRWANRFDANKRYMLQHAENHDLWRGFARLSEHPRLTSVPDWERTIQQVAETELYDHHRQDLLRVLERSPHSYVFTEETLSKTSNFIHFRHDEVDRLDDAAQRLFHEGA